MNYLSRKAVFFVVVLLLPYGVSAQELSERDNPEVQRIVPFQVFDNLYYVGARWVSAWLLVSDQGLILFDSLY